MRVASRLLFGTVAVLLFAVVIVVWASRTALRVHLEGQLRADLTEEARLIQAVLPDSPETWPRLVGRLAALRTHRVTVIDARGRAVADNQVPPGVLESQADLAALPEVAAALAGRPGSDIRADPGEARRAWVTVPGEPIVRVSSDLAALEAAASRSQRAIFTGALLAVLLGSVLALLAGRNIARPLAQLAATARTIPAGPAPRFPRSGLHEIDQLSLALREMHQALSDRFDALRREQAESAALVDAMVEGVLAGDSRGRIITANPAARRLLGYGPEEAMPDLAGLFRAKAAREIVDASRSGVAIQDREIDLDGRSLLVNARPLPGGGVVLVLHDISELRRLETVRRDFVANVSHELKTPLTSISGYAETLLSEDPDAATRRQFLRTILANAHRMQELVDDQLDLSRIESGRWQPAAEAIDVAAAAQEAWLPRRDRAAAGRIGFDIDAGPGATAIRADREALRQILGNLLDNAIRYTPPGGRIRCHTEVEGTGVALCVSDTGPGIGSDHLPRIFERYYRADPGRGRESGGTGLGLAIVKNLVEAHDGRVAAESELGRGTTIRCWFPNQAGSA